MADPLDDLILELLMWLEAEPRPYSEVMEGWRTSCPGLGVWEEAVERRFVLQVRRDGGEALVDLSPAGRGFVQSRR